MKSIAEITEQWSYHHFVLFVYMHIAMADNQLVSSEWEAMKAKMGQLSGNEYKHLYHDVWAVYERCNDFQIVDVMDNLLSRLTPGPAERARLLSDVKDIVNADDHVSIEELEVELFLKKFLA